METDRRKVLRHGGVPVTARRLAVARSVSDAQHVTADVVAATVRGEIGSVSIHAVFDALATSTEKGLLPRIRPAGSPARCDNRVADNHHHVIGRVRERMLDVDCAVGDPPCLTAVEDFDSCESTRPRSSPGAGAQGVSPHRTCERRGTT